MTDRLPDQPEKLKPTAEKPFCNCEASHPPLFAIRPRPRPL